MTNGCFTAQLNGTHIPAFIRVFDTFSHLSSQSSDKIIIIIEVPVTEIVHIKKMSKKHKSCANVALLEKCFRFQENLCAAHLTHITMMMHIRWKSFTLFSTGDIYISSYGYTRVCNKLTFDHQLCFQRSKLFSQMFRNPQHWWLDCHIRSKSVHHKWNTGAENPSRNDGHFPLSVDDRTLYSLF